MFGREPGGEWEKRGSRVGRREDQSSRWRCDLYVERRHFQKAAMILVEINPIDFYFKSIIRLLGRVFDTHGVEQEVSGAVNVP